MVDLVNSLHIAASGMKAQGDRLRVVSQNIANADSLPTKPGEMPYRRKTISFKERLDKETGVDKVKVYKYGYDDSDFKKKYDPGHPAADAEGYVLTPNVNTIMEMVDMKEAQRGYEANLNVIEVSKSMIQRTVDMLR
ncbi:MAG: flagellar basal body rod protein FlgC [Alphaproteobacteria bacterium]|nr:flagellar basal body rod protein FlgC [Alphaproteobacteria bacterium]